MRDHADDFSLAHPVTAVTMSVTAITAGAVLLRKRGGRERPLPSRRSRLLESAPSLNSHPLVYLSATLTDGSPQLEVWMVVRALGYADQTFIQ